MIATLIGIFVGLAGLVVWLFGLLSLIGGIASFQWSVAIIGVICLITGGKMVKAFSW